jgi:cation diffusion facilitator family transporter
MSTKAPPPKRAPAWAAAISLAGALVVLGVKYLAYHLTGSVALYSDALESIVNVAAAGLALVLLRVAARPPDEEHPFGHAKAEYFSAVVEGSLILVAAIGIVREAIPRLLAPTPITEAALGLGVSAGASAINAGLGFFLLREGKKANSPALKADGTHVLTDVVTSVGVVIGTALAAITGVLILDPLLAIVVAVLIVVTGWKLVRESIGGLMDRAAPEDVKKRIEAAIDKELAAGMGKHRLRTRVAGNTTFVDLHVTMPSEIPLREAHAVCDRIETAVCAAIQEVGADGQGEPTGADVTVHVEPDGAPD